MKRYEELNIYYRAEILDSKIINMPLITLFHCLNTNISNNIQQAGYTDGYREPPYSLPLLIHAGLFEF